MLVQQPLISSIDAHKCHIRVVLDGLVFSGFIGFCFSIQILVYYRGQPKAGTGHKMRFVSFVFWKSRFQGPAFRCDSSLEAIEDIPDKDYNFWGNENFHNLYKRLLHERKLKSGYLERRIYERPLHLRVNLLSRIKANIFQNYLYINPF